MRVLCSLAGCPVVGLSCAVQPALHTFGPLSSQIPPRIQLRLSKPSTKAQASPGKGSRSLTMAITPSHRGPSRRNRFLVALTFLLPVSALHVFINPYTKVEESFTIQAVHDILTYGLSTSALLRYDHHLFPGAVPRSFIGPILLSTAAYPRIWAARVLGWTTTSADIQTLVRWTLSDVYALSLSLFATAIFPSRSPYRTKAKNETGHSDQYARGTSAFYFFILLSCAQFHANFWGGRTVPNSIALPFGEHHSPLYQRFNHPNRLRSVISQCSYPSHSSLELQA